MARITVEDCLVQENNRFALVQLASKRTKQLLRGSRAKIAEVKNKAVVTALREIAAGEVRFMTPEEAERQREADERRRAEAMTRVQENPLNALMAEPTAPSLALPSEETPPSEELAPEKNGMPDSNGTGEPPATDEPTSM